MFDGSGNLYLKGSCTATSTCTAPSDAPLIMQNSTGSSVSYIDNSGNLCVQDANCNGNDASCSNPSDGAFVVQDSGGNNVLYINATGTLCMTGYMYQNSGI